MLVVPPRSRTTQPPAPWTTTVSASTAHERGLGLRGEDERRPQLREQPRSVSTPSSSIAAVDERSTLTRGASAAATAVERSGSRASE